MKTPRFLVVEPGSVDEAIAVVEAARERGVCLHPWSSGSGVLGAALPPGECAVVSTSRLRGAEVLAGGQIVHSMAGTRIHEVLAAAEEKGLTVPLLPQSLELASAAGVVSTLASGMIQPGAGNVEDVVQYVDIVLSGDGLVRLGSDVNPRGRVGPSLLDAVLGSEGGAGLIVGVGFRARARPRSEARIACRTRSLSDALRIARRLSQWNTPHVMRVIDEDEASLMFSEEGPLLVASYYAAVKGIAEALGDALKAECESAGGEVLGEEVYERVFAERWRYAERLESLYKAGLWADTIDIAAGWDLLEDAWRRVKSRLSKVKGVVAVMAHSGHFYPGGAAVYFIVVGEARPSVFARAWREALDEAASLGASVTHHHGIGRAKLPWALKELGEARLKVLCRVLDALDPYRVFRGSPLRRVCMRLTAR